VLLWNNVLEDVIGIGTTISDRNVANAADPLQIGFWLAERVVDAFTGIKSCTGSGEGFATCVARCQDALEAKTAASFAAGDPTTNMVELRIVT
jgi:hypothetical protein